MARRPAFTLFVISLHLALTAFWTAQEEIQMKKVYSFEVGMETPPANKRYTAPPDLQELRVKQKLDHLNSKDGRSWQQRYFLSRKFYRPGSPVILHLSGEGPADGTVNNNGLLGDLAEVMGALTIDLEHRYYGTSRPTKNLSGKNLRFMNVDQVVADIAAFTIFFKRESGLVLGRWLLAAGSYAGTIATWARERHPHLFHAAYVSSAPLLAKLGFPEFHEEAAAVWRLEDPRCPAIVSKAMVELDLLVAQGQGATIARTFDLCEPELKTSCEEDVWNVEFFVSMVLSALQPGAACELLLSSPGPALHALARVVLAFAPPGDCLVSSYRDTLLWFRRRTDWPSEDYNIVRQWYYQMCTEFGWFFTLNSDNQPYGRRLPLEFFRRWCDTVYVPGVSLNATEAGIARTNREHGGRSPNVTRVLFTHGSLDPWRRLGVTENVGSDILVVMMEGEMHASDVSQPTSEDSPALMAARRRIMDILTAWMQ